MAPTTLPERLPDITGVTVTTTPTFHGGPYAIPDYCFHQQESAELEQLRKEVADLKRQLSVSNRELFQLRNRRR